MLPKGCQREAHDVIVTSLNAGDTHHTYPFLDAVGTGLVERTVGVDIMDNLAVAEGAEIDISTFREVDSPFAGAKTDTSVNGMMTTRERMKHIDGLLARGRLPKRLVVENNDGVGSDENVGN